MYGHRPRSRPPSGSGRRPPPQPPPPPPPSQPPPPPLNPRFPFQNPNFYQNPAVFPQPFNPFCQNPDILPAQNPTFPFQNPSIQFPNTAFQLQNPSPRPAEALERIDGSVAKARRDLVAAGEGVTAWKVSQVALSTLQADSWESMGYRMQEVPSLHGLMVAEGKINAFIHCFVGVRRITSLYELEVSICKNEGVRRFEELEFGPLVRHPLIVHYFSLSSDAEGVFKITAEEIVCCLMEYMDCHKRKDVQVEKLLDFVAKKRAVTGREKLGVRIQSLGLYITSLKKMKKIEDMTLAKCLILLKEKSNSGSKKRPLFSSQKKQLDEHFSFLSERFKAFSSENEDFGGKHIRFISSSSEDDNDDDEFENKKDDKDAGSSCKFSSQNPSFDKVSSCPYPSETEEMQRLGLKVETIKPHSYNNSLKYENSYPDKKRRRLESSSSSVVKEDLLEGTAANNNGLSLPDDSLRLFITTWKEASMEHTGAEVFDRMLQFYDVKDRQRKRMKLLFSSYPYVGLLNVALASMKCGMWDSIYDAFRDFQLNDSNPTVTGNIECESIDVEPDEENVMVIAKDSLEHTSIVTVEDVIHKIAVYFELDHDVHLFGQSDFGKKCMFLRKLCNCEDWLAEQFSVKEFKSLGYGDFFSFLDRQVSMLPSELFKCLMGESPKKFPLEVSMLQHQLVVFLSQASNSLSEDDTLSNLKISELLMRQFPSVSFRISENGRMEELLDIMRKETSSSIFKSVIFSLTLSGLNYYGKNSECDEEKYLRSTSIRSDISQKAGILGPVTSKDAVDALLRAPMLSNLLEWSHWDLIFAPCLGPLVEWLLNEVTTKDLLCLLTKDGRLIRIDNSATVDSFLEALLQGSSFQTAVKLLSLLSLYGGIRHVPVALLKGHSRKAFEVFFKNSADNRKVSDNHNCLVHGKIPCGKNIPDEHAIYEFSRKKHKCISQVNEAVPHASRFVLECLGYLPSEARPFAADVLLSGLQIVTKNAPSAILGECKETEQQLMLHEVGLSLGIVEWINDYHVFCYSSISNSSMSSWDSGLKGARSILRAMDSQDTSDDFSNSGRRIDPTDIDEHNCGNDEVDHRVTGAEVSASRRHSIIKQNLSGFNENKDGALVIESIRREEFGLDPSLSDPESSLLKKQHARLGRALHCLSQELYSQDSHFLLELVQNADDNMYPIDVEPTLIFILGEEGIIILNNEQGFSEQNIRALCDVGSSTKKGSAAGYIGQKGIGFKSVFRVTDAPEIHSNGFHVKFDISDGEIGFVLPTVVPPCNLDSFQRLLSSRTDQMEESICWNTCIVLPFRSNLSGGPAMNNLLSMFSDLHPSLLLFLHRLKCIKFRNMIDNSLIVMRKEITGDGIINVTHGEEKMTWLVVSEKLDAEVMRPGVKTTEISVAFTLNETDDGNYSAHLEQQPVFAFLPLRTYGLKFILQGDFVLPSSREEVNGDSPWNQWLLSEFPGLFVRAERSFCALACFSQNPGKAVTAYLSFVPVIGEVHGFFSNLPRMIISKLRMSNCLLLEGDQNKWVPPCKVLRSWDAQAHLLLPDNLLYEHLGVGFLHKDIVLSGPLASALGIEEYGPKTLLQVMMSLCRSQNGLKSMGLGWLCSWLNALYTMLFYPSAKSSHNGMELDIICNLKKISFIPLSDGTFGAVDEGTIWLHFDAISHGHDGGYGLEAFPNLCARLRVVSPELFAVAASDGTSMDLSMVSNLSVILKRVGVQQFAAHEIVKLQILPALFNERITDWDKNLMTEYLSFVMFHLQSCCASCHVDRGLIISELHNKAFIMTNHGPKRPCDVPIHFSKEYLNPVDADTCFSNTNVKWHEVDIAYLKHPVTKLLSSGVMKWREFFKALGVSDFVRILQVEKSVAHIPATVLENMLQDSCLIFPDSIIQDWVSHELDDLLSSLSLNGDKVRAKYLLEVLNMLWDDCFSDKVTSHCNLKQNGDIKALRSSFISNICVNKWVASSMDDELHYPRDLFYDCDAISSILGVSAPYAIPQVQNKKLLTEIGLKTQVTLDDALAVLRLWRSLETPFKASITQMSKFYSFLWNEMGTSRQEIIKEIHSGPSIFVPFASHWQHQDAVLGMLLPLGEVCWHDSTGLMHQVEGKHQQYCSFGGSFPLSKTLSNIYPGHHDFFVKYCGVQEIPSLRSYLQLLIQLSEVSLPSEVAYTVFQVLLKWADGLRSGLLSSEDIVYLKESLLGSEFTVLPTALDRWVSLHPSFGLVCWCDNEDLRKEFKHLGGIDFLYFGEVNSNKKERDHADMSILMKALCIPALSEVVSHKAIYNDLADSRSKASLVNWSLPYAQRYLNCKHPDVYLRLKLSGFESINQLQVIVVKELSYQNIIERCNVASKKHFKCSSLLQDKVLYTATDSDSHSIFLELSRLFFSGTPDLYLANFLHMITTMVELGSTEEQMELFILNSQKVPKLLDQEPAWSVKSLLTSAVKDVPLATGCGLIINNDQNAKSTRKPVITSSWPPAEWKNAPGFSYAQSDGVKTQAPIPQTGDSLVKENDDYDVTTAENADDICASEDGPAAIAVEFNLPGTETMEKPSVDCNVNDYCMDVVVEPVVVAPRSGGSGSSLSKFGEREQLLYGVPNNKQATVTGRLGEHVAFDYFCRIYGDKTVKWINKDTETGKPYDIIVEDKQGGVEFIEVKSTRSPRKDWFIISLKEWQFASEMGESFSIAHVVLSGNNAARKVTIFKNPEKLRQDGSLRLVVLMPKS